MKRLLCGSAIVAMALAGCGKESAPGGPGIVNNNNPPATSTTGTTARAYMPPEEQTFTVSVPSGTTNLEQGEAKDITIDIDRGENFNQNLTLKFAPPAGVKVTPNELQLMADDEEAKVSIEIDPDAALGETAIDVTAVPETGQATSVDMRIKVEKAD